MEMKKELAEAIVNPASYKDFEKIHAVFTELRQTAPVALAKPKGFEPFQRCQLARQLAVRIQQAPICTNDRKTGGWR